MARIIRNAARCLRCGDVIESTFGHHWVACSCGAIYVDGGHAYLRRGGDPNDVEELSEVSEESDRHADEP